MKYSCYCCGYKTLDEDPKGSYEICSVCGWEDDSVQSGNPDYEGGANGISLREAQHQYANESGSEPRDIEFDKDSGWVMLLPPKYNPKKIKTDFIVSPKGDVSDT